MPRQPLNHVSLVPPPPSKAKRNRAWENQNPTVSYRLPLVLRDQITSLAKAELITSSELVRYLLEYSLSQVNAGNLPLEPQLQTGKFTLFPEN